MHSRARGKSGSKKPDKKIPSWAPFKEKEVEKLVVKFTKTGNSASQVGTILRDSYGINSIKALTGKSLTAILAENKLSGKLPEDMLSLIKKMIKLKMHLEKNRLDQTARLGLALAQSRIGRLTKYYKRSGRLPEGWKLDMERLKMYIE